MINYAPLVELIKEEDLDSIKSKYLELDNLIKSTIFKLLDLKEFNLSAKELVGFFSERKELG